MIEIARFVLGLITFAGWAWGASYVAFHRSGQHPSESPGGLRLIDLFALFVMLPIPLLLAKLASESPSVATQQAIVVGGLLELIFIAIWRDGCTTLTKRGIDESGRRFVYLGMLLPVTTFGCVAFILSSLISPEYLPPWLLLTIWTTSAALAWLTAYGYAWVLSGTADQIEPGASDS